MYNKDGAEVTVSKDLLKGLRGLPSRDLWTKLKRGEVRLFLSSETQTRIAPIRRHPLFFSENLISSSHILIHIEKYQASLLASL